MVAGRWVRWPSVTPRAGEPADVRSAPTTARRPISSRCRPRPLELGPAFAAAGHELHLVGGPVRDALMGRPCDDLDFTTDARPEQVLEIVAPLASATWTTGIEFGTVGAQVARRCAARSPRSAPTATTG